MPILPDHADRSVPPVVAPIADRGGFAHRAAGALHSLQVGHPHQNPRVSRWRVARAGGVGAASGLFLALGLFGPDSIAYKPWSDVALFILVGLITIIVGFSIIEPFVEWLHHGTPDHGQVRRAWYQRAAWWLVITVAVSLFALMEDALRETLTLGKFTNVRNWFGALAISGLITYGWTLGAKRGAPFAALYGTLAAVLVALFVSALLILGVVLTLMQQNIAVRPSDVLTQLGGVLALLVNNMVLWTLCAAAGGFAIDYGRGLTPSLRILIAIVGVFALMTIGLYPVIDELRVWVGDVARALGWGVALCLYRPADLALSTRKEPTWTATAFASLAIGSVLILATVGSFLLALMVESSQSGPVPLVQNRMVVTGVSTGEHGRFVLSYTFFAPGLPDNQKDLSVHIWDMEAQEEYRRLLGHTDRILDAAFLHEPEGVLASVGADHTLRLWEIEHGTQILEPPFTVGTSTEGLIAARFSPHAEHLVVATDAARLLLYDVRTGELLREFEAPGLVGRIAFADEETFVTGGAALARWDIRDAKPAQTIFPADAPILTLDARKNLLATGGSHGEVRLYDLSSLELKWYNDPHVGAVTALALSPSGDTLMAAFESGSVGLWDTPSADLYYGWNLAVNVSATNPVGNSSAAVALHLTSDLTALSGDDAGRLLLWRLPHHYPWTQKLKSPASLPPTTAPAASAPVPL